jgi:hypothetical protein
MNIFRVIYSTTEHHNTVTLSCTCHNLLIPNQIEHKKPRYFTFNMHPTYSWQREATVQSSNIVRLEKVFVSTVED